VNERHPSGYTPDHAYDAYPTGSYPTVGTTYAEDATGTYAYIPQQPAPYDQQYAYGSGYTPGYDQSAQQPAQSYAPGTYGTGGYDTGTYDTGAYNGYDTGTYDTGGQAAYDSYAYGPGAPAPTGATYYDTGTYDAGTLWQNGQQPPTAPAGYPQQQDWDSGAYPAYGYGYGYGYDASGDTGVYEQMPANGAAAPYDTTAGYGQAPGYETPAYGTPAHQPAAAPAPEPYAAPYEPHAEPYDDTALLDMQDGIKGFDGIDELDEVLTPAGSGDDEPIRHEFAADSAPVAAARSRRRKPARRSALLTVGVPSVAVMGVAAVGAAAIGGVGAAQDAPHAAADAAAKAPTTQLDRQLSGVSRDADDFATRASRAQERVDLKDRQAAAKKAKDEAAARKEALRPKYVLPVKQKGLSALFGQSGEHWMALHTGIDFPVQVGTPVEAVTDGTVRTQWNSSYGNMAIVTAPDGTETWYCHLSSTKIRSGKVKAGDVIAYSGNTGNTTGPHLHLEVRPHGGSPIDPLPWLLSHGLDPR
jgi:murein DD-endopeptidase MepM/ murein hydrolase activator NlpD